MWWAFQPFTMQGFYFSLCASTQIKTYPFHLCLLQSHHILREQKPRYAKKPLLRTNEPKATSDDMQE